ncbi:MAG: hypothetical protein ACRCV3_06290 [Desulfovibrionaceae bacterium]
MKQIFLAALTVVLYTSVTFALPPMNRIDGNGDGKITPEEFAYRFKDSKREDFDAIDANKDGILDKAEMDEYRSKMGGKQPGKTREGTYPSL